MKLILVTDGQYWAIKQRRFFGGTRYFDLKNPGHWWSIDDSYFKDCWTDEETAKLWFKRLSV
jgi:hypothetical protein